MNDRAVTIYTDGASSGNPGPAGAGAILFDADGKTLASIARPLGSTTNNVAEYLALVYALIEAQRRGERRLIVRTDSELLVKQLNGAYKVRDATLRLLHDLTAELLRGFASTNIKHVPREENSQADRLARQGAKASASAV